MVATAARATFEDVNGGNGGQGNTPTAYVTLNAGGDVSVTETGTPPGPGARVAAQLIGGNGGGTAAEYANGGSGQDAGAPSKTAASITVTNANVTTKGDRLPGLQVIALGGTGGDGGVGGTSSEDSGGGSGGFAGNSAITVTATTGAVTISTAGSNSPAVDDLNQGGTGGAGGDSSSISKQDLAMAAPAAARVRYR